MSVFDPLKNLFKSKRELAFELEQLRSAVIEAEGALANCARLEVEIPGYILAIKGRTETDPVKDSRHVRALERLKADLPRIRAHWEKRLRSLA